MAHQSRDWRRSESSRHYGRGSAYRPEDERGFGRAGQQWDEENDFGPRSAQGIGDYGGYGEDQYRGGRASRGGGESSSEFLRRSPWREDRSRSFGSDGGPDYGRAYGAPYESSAGNYDDSGHYGGDYLSRDWDMNAGRPQRWSNAGYEGAGGREGGRWPREEQPQRWGRGDRGYPSSGYSGYRGQSASGERHETSGGYGPSGRSDFSRSGEGSWQGQQSHRGKGPRGYERTDDRLKEVICERLSDDPDIDASEITVNVSGGNVKLTGTVNSRADKYQVEELIEQCGGVKDIDNQLRTQSRQGGQSSNVGGSSGLSGSYGSGSSSYEASGNARRGESGASSSATTTSSGSSGKKQ